MELNKQNKKDLINLGFTWDCRNNYRGGEYVLTIKNGDKFACFTESNCQSELSAYLLGWKSALI